MNGGRNVLLGLGGKTSGSDKGKRGALGEERLYCVHVALWFSLLFLT